MEEKIEKLRNAIKGNPNLSDEFKRNVETLTDLIVTVFPEYDYSYMEGVLSTLILGTDNEMEGYSSYNRDTNTLSFNTDKIFDDMVDIQHLFLNELLKCSTSTSLGYEGFKDGVTEAISTVMNEDGSLSKLNPLEHTLITAFSEIVDPSILISSYMNGTVVDVIAYLDTYGISKQEFDNLARAFNNLHNGMENNTAFTDAEVQMIDMYKKVVGKKLENGSIGYEDISSRFDKFRNQMIFNRSELITLYPYHDFSNMSGFERVEKAFGEAIVSLENKEEILDVSTPTK